MVHNRPPTAARPDGFAADERDEAPQRPEFGDRLRRIREEQGISLEQIAERSGIGLRYLAALEDGSFEVLPGRAIGKLYIRAYAEILDFQAQPLIEAYDLEQQRRTREGLEGPTSPRLGLVPGAGETPRRVPAYAEVEAEAEAEAEEASAERPVEATVEVADQPAEVEVVPEPVEAEVAPDRQTVPSSSPRPHLPAGRRRWQAAIVTFIAASVLIVMIFRGIGGDSPRPAAADGLLPFDPTSMDSPQAPERPVNPPEPIAEPEPVRLPVEAVEPAAPSMPPGTLSVSDFALGRRLDGQRVEQRGDRFAEGSRVLFQTRVLGGVSGQTVRHVWLREGRVVQGIELELGGGHWRTHSRKTLWGVGSWAVEARDADGQVLARAVFDCVSAD